MQTRLICIEKYINKIINGNALEVLKEMPSESVHSIVTDPPYGISFMNKKWDYNVPSVKLWKEILRVLKPGGHALVACGTRTQHRMAVNLEDAGFEIRDIVSWVYGSGFPKSLDISKAIDKKRVGDKFWELRSYLKDCIKKSLLTQREIKSHLGYPENSGVIGHWIGQSQPCTPSGKDWQKMKKILPIDNRYDHLILEAEREVIGKSKAGFHEKNNVFKADKEGYGDYNLTRAETFEAKKWNGWGTALKPAMELWTLCRKPLSERTIASNVLKHETGGLNIDRCRVATDNDDREGVGRFPANFIHDGSDEVTGLFPNTKSGNMKGQQGGFGNSSLVFGDNSKTPDAISYADQGSASRFFYCAKASKSERNKGLENNNHPTVKPISLMRYLCKLITPPNGIVLDPFIGSGSTGIGAKLEGFNYIGIEREEEYCQIAEARIKAHEKQKKLNSDFSDIPKCFSSAGG